MKSSTPPLGPSTSSSSEVRSPLQGPLQQVPDPECDNVIDNLEAILKTDSDGSRDHFKGRQL